MLAAALMALVACGSTSANQSDRSPDTPAPGVGVIGPGGPAPGTSPGSPASGSGLRGAASGPNPTTRATNPGGSTSTGQASYGPGDLTLALGADGCTGVMTTPGVLWLKVSVVPKWTGGGAFPPNTMTLSADVAVKSVSTTVSSAQGVIVSFGGPGALNTVLGRSFAVLVDIDSAKTVNETNEANNRLVVNLSVSGSNTYATETKLPCH